MNEAVVSNDVGSRKQLGTAARDQSGVTRTGADEIDDASLLRMSRSDPLYMDVA
jgi:hypothetical protein